MFNNLTLTVQGLSKVMIQDRLDLTKHELSNIFDPISQYLLITRDHGEKGLFRNINDQEDLNRFFIPILKNSPSISSLMIANDQGDEYMLLKTDRLWITRITKNGSKTEHPKSYYWRESRKNADILLDHVEETNDYDPRKRPWYKLAVKSDVDSITHWTHPYTFFTTKQPGMTTSTKWKDQRSGLSYVIAMDILIADLSEFTTNIDVTTNGKVFILTDKSEVIGLPKDDRFISEDSRNHYTLKKLIDLDIPLLNTAIEEYRIQKSDQKYFTFRFNNEIWWLGVERFKLSNTNVIVIGVVVPETDFYNDIQDTRHILIGGFILILLFFLIILYSFIEMKRANRIIALEKNKNEKLLLNTLPIKVVNDLKENGRSDPQKFKNVTVFFSDIVGFTEASSNLDPKKLIKELNDIYSAFDDIMIKYDCERIKTIGDAYLAVCGMPLENTQHAEMILKASFEIIQYIQKRNISTQLRWQIRIGLHSGNVVGGIVGVKKYIYDVFGDTINTASRMESNSEPMRVNISSRLRK